MFARSNEHIDLLIFDFFAIHLFMWYSLNQSHITMKNTSKTYHELLLKTYKRLADHSSSARTYCTTFFEKFQFPAFITDTKGCFIFFNQSAERLTGYSKKEVLGRHFRLLFTLDDLSDGFLFFYQTMKGCYSEHSRFRIRCQSGSTKVVDVLAAPITFDGKIWAALGIAQDVSGQKSDITLDQERTKIFKKFSKDVDQWDKENKQIKGEVQKILMRLNHKNNAGDRN